MKKKYVVGVVSLMAITCALCACSKKADEPKNTTPVVETKVEEPIQETIAEPIIDEVPEYVDEYEQERLNRTKPSADVKLETGKIIMDDGTEMDWAQALTDEMKEKYGLEITFDNGTVLIDSLSRNYYIVEVVLPDGITEIIDCFNNCDSLVKLAMPDSVTLIENSMNESDKVEIVLKDSSTKNLKDGVLYSEDEKTLLSYLTSTTNTTFIVPDGVETIARNAITNNVYLEELTLSSSVKTLEYNSIANCPKLRIVSLNDDLEKVSHSLINLNSLELLRIPDKTVLLDNSLSGCLNLTTIIVGDENENYSVDDSILYNKDMTNMIFYPASKADVEFIIPDSVVSCEYDAMRQNQNLEELTLSPNMVDITMFINSCHTLKKVNIPATVKSIDDLVFFNLDSLTEIHFEGTEDQWNAVEKSPDWIISQGEYTVTFGK